MCYAIWQSKIRYVGSTSTLVDEHVARELGVQGEAYPLCLQWTGGIERAEDNSQLINIEILGRGSQIRLLKAAHHVNKICLLQQSLRFERLSEDFLYLRGLLVDGYSNVSPTILIGLDNTHLKIPLKIREGRIRVQRKPG